MVSLTIFQFDILCSFLLFSIQDLQISILKGCWFHLLLLRPVSLFDAERDGWITPKGVIPTDILKNATGYVQLHDDHVRYCRFEQNELCIKDWMWWLDCGGLDIYHIDDDDDDIVFKIHWPKSRVCIGHTC